jgi:hypothetical protein
LNTGQWRINICPSSVIIAVFGIVPTETANQSLYVCLGLYFIYLFFIMFRLIQEQCLYTRRTLCSIFHKIPPSPLKSKDVPQQAEVALGVPGRLRPRIISTFGTTRVVGRQPYRRRNPWYSFSEAGSTSGHMVLSDGTTEKIPSDTTRHRSRDRPTSSAAP